MKIRTLILKSLYLGIFWYLHMAAVLRPWKYMSWPYTRINMVETTILFVFGKSPGAWDTKSMSLSIFSSLRIFT